MHCPILHRLSTDAAIFWSRNHAENVDQEQISTYQKEKDKMKLMTFIKEEEKSLLAFASIIKCESMQKKCSAAKALIVFCHHKSRGNSLHRLQRWIHERNGVSRVCAVLCMHEQVPFSTVICSLKCNVMHRPTLAAAAPTWGKFLKKTNFSQRSMSLCRRRMMIMSK